MDADGGLETKIISPELYDSSRAKIDSNLRWLFAKAYGEDGSLDFGECLWRSVLIQPQGRAVRIRIHPKGLKPELYSRPFKIFHSDPYHIQDDLRDPFYMDQYGVEHIKPLVLELLLSAELYSRVCTFLSLGKQSTTRHTHLSVLQALARQSIHVLEPDGAPVTHHHLSSAPIRMSSHIPLIDALMLACTMEMMNIEQVVSCQKRFATFSPTKELQRPFHIEEAMVFWINKVISRTREICENEFKLKHQLMDSPCHQKVRYRRDHVSSRILPHLPEVDDLTKDLCDGAALLTVIHYYCPEYMRLEDICLKEVLSLSDSAYNIQLLSEFSNEYLNRCLYLRTEDFLYAPAVLKHNLMVYIAELFWWFEVIRPDFVKPKDLQDIKDVRALAQAKSSRPHMPVSNFTKRSFLSTSPSVDSLATGSGKDNSIRYYRPLEESASVSKASTSYSLHTMQQRQQNSVQVEDTDEFRNRSSSLSHMDRQSPVSRLAWMERRQSRPISQLQMEWQRVGGDNISLARSISKDSLASNVMAVTPRHHVNVQPSQDEVHSNDPEEKEEELVAILGPRGMCGFREPQSDSFFLEPLQPAVLRPNKEKISVVSKREESGEELIERRRGGPSPIEHAVINQSFTTIDAVEPEKINSGQSGGFFLHRNSELPRHGKHEGVCGASESDIENDDMENDDIEDDDIEDDDIEDDDIEDDDIEDDDIDDDDIDNDDVEEKELGSTLLFPGEKLKCPSQRKEDDESAKLCEDVQVCEHRDKDGTSGRCSPCPSSFSQASSTSSRMTCFAERRLHRTLHDGCSSASSSHATTPDGSENGTLSPDAKEPVASDLVHLRLQLEDKRRAIEAQKKKVEVLMARQRLQLGKAAFLNVVKKGHSDTLPHQAKQELSQIKQKVPTKDDAYIEVMKAKSKETERNLHKESRKLWEDSVSPAAAVGLEKDNHMSERASEEEAGDDFDLSKCSRTIEHMTNDIDVIQKAMIQLSFQQERLIKQTLKSPPQEYMTKPEIPEAKPQAPVVEFLEMSTATRRPPKLSSSCSALTKPLALRLSKENSARPGSKVSARTPSLNSRTPTECRTPRAENEEEDAAKTFGHTPGRAVARNTTFRLHDSGNQRSEGQKLPKHNSPVVDERSGPAKEIVVCQSEEKKAQLIEVALSDITDAPDSGEQKSGLGFFYKDDQKAPDELDKKRAAFLLKQQKKDEEKRLRKQQQQEAESELTRDDVRRMAEEDKRKRKEEEKARRELIKQEYLRKKQQELMEEQGVALPRPHHRRPRPKSLHRGQSGSTTSVCLCAAPSGSSLSLASAATDADSVTSGGGSQRGESVESFSILSRNAGRNMERDWDSGSRTSSIASAAEYSGLKLFKEPSAKSNKLIIQNAIAHCCLAGKVNEAQKNAVLEEIERKCEANHLMILFRDGGCQFRAIYVFLPDTQELTKLTGTGPRAITVKMIDMLYKYSSDRKQFTVIPAKTVSASVDAITIYNHLWQLKRHCSSKRK